MREKQALVSIVIPAYKVEKYMKRCLESILGQSYKNLQIIVINDASPDKTGEICDQIASKDSRIEVIHHSINQGVSAARNSGIQVARGEYIAFVDGDDFIAYNLIEKCIANIHSSDVVIFNVSTVRKNEIIENHMENSFFKNRDTVYKAIIEDKIPNYLCNKFFKSSFWNSIRLVENTEFEDLMIMPLVFKNIQSVVYLDEPLYFYNCDNDNSITNNINAKRKYGLFYSFLTRQSLAKEIGMDDFVQYCRHRAIRSAVGGIGLNYAKDELTEKQVLHMLEYLQKEEFSESRPDIGIKYEILLYGALHNRWISKIYGKTMYILEKLKNSF